MQSHTPASIPGEVWQTSGSSEHIGGIRATQDLIQYCAVRAGQRVLDIGCGTGFTLYLLAQEYGVQAVGVDLSMQLLSDARLRANMSDHPQRVQLIHAHGGELPFSTGAFDCALIESVLVHAHAERLLTETYRVLAPGGRLGINEMTFIQPPPAELVDLLEVRLGIKTRQPDEWNEIFERADFRTMMTETRPFSLREQLRNHFATDGFKGYLTSLRKGLSNRRLRSAFLNREMLSAARRFSNIVGGYGLYVVEKPRIG